MENELFYYRLAIAALKRSYDCGIELIDAIEDTCFEAYGWDDPDNPSVSDEQIFAYTVEEVLSLIGKVNA